MKRKVVKLGPATLVVSLPVKWTKKHKVQAGDEVELEEQPDSIVITTQKRAEIEKYVVDFSQVNHMQNRILDSYYYKGADEIEVKFNTLEKSRKIQTRLNTLMGLEVIEQSKERILIKDLNLMTEDNFESMLKRVLFLLDSLSDEILKTLHNED